MKSKHPHPSKKPPDKEAPTRMPASRSPNSTEKAMLDDKLDEAIEESFPASDPISISPPESMTKEERK
jgi:hypothetical protein